jgi:hypothetical protein
MRYKRKLLGISQIKHTHTTKHADEALICHHDVTGFNTIYL